MSVLKRLHDIIDSLEDEDIIHKVDRLITELPQEAKRDIELLQQVKAALQK